VWEPVRFPLHADDLDHLCFGFTVGTPAYKTIRAMCGRGRNRPISLLQLSKLTGENVTRSLICGINGIWRSQELQVMFRSKYGQFILARRSAPNKQLSLL